MRLLTYRDRGRSRAGALVDGRVVDVARRLAAHGAVIEDISDLIEKGPAFWERTEDLLRGADEDGRPVEAVELRPPLVPGAVICGGANFEDHLRETNRRRPDRVEFFFKSPTTVIGPRDDVRMDRRLSSKYDYEVELGVVIGRPAYRVAARDALSYVFGYLVVNDVSIRDRQIVLDDDGTSHGRFGCGKSFRDACPIGPWIVTASEVPDPGRLELEACVDGERRQLGAMRDAIWGVAELVSYYSTFLTLRPGWIVAAGTPGGPALGSDRELRADPYPRTDGVARGGYVRPGQLVECRIDAIGSLANRYVLAA